MLDTPNSTGKPSVKPVDTESSTDDKHLWSKWYWDAWASDPGLGLCSYSARGVWMDLLVLMAASTQKGVLLVNKVKPTPKELLRLTRGNSLAELTKALAELEKFGVPGVTSEGFWYSRRMVRDAAKSQIAKEFGVKGGRPAKKTETQTQNPPLSKSRNPPAKPKGSDAAKPKPQSPDTDTDTEADTDREKDQDQTPSGSSPTGGDAPPPPKADEEKDTAPTKALLSHFDSLHQKRLGHRAVIQGGKDAKTLASLWRTHKGLVSELMVDFFDTDDEFIQTRGYTVGVFYSQFAQLMAKKAAARLPPPRPTRLRGVPSAPAMVYKTAADLGLRKKAHLG